MRELWQLPATTLAEAFRRGELSPVEVIEAVLTRMDAVNPRLNAIVTLDAPAVRAAAAASERRWRDGHSLGPLDGVPLTVKDNIPAAGLRCTWGSQLYADFIPGKDELPIARLRAQGAVILGKTNVPEFTLQGYTDNLLFGPTRNPWDSALTPGGSSGGAVAAVASGMGPLAVATDGGGSIRRPAAHAGLVGLKPSRGRVPRIDGLPVILHDLEVIGPIARTVADAALLFGAMAGPAAPDINPHLHAPPLPDTRQRIRYVRRFGDAPVDPQILASVDELARILERLGHVVEPGEVPFDIERSNLAFARISAAGLAWLMWDFNSSENRISPAMAELADNGDRLTAVQYVEALETLRVTRETSGHFFSNHTLLLTPTTAALSWPIGQTHPPVIAGQPVGPRGHAVFTSFANVAGVPALSLPCRPSAEGLPIGAQLVAGHGGDERLLAIAAQIEAAQPWADRWPAM
jgi:aspartyl-tRNA(Asn)/glutamyl-tRNA(Gln) amidotransferase subunit A